MFNACGGAQYCCSSVSGPAIRTAVLPSATRSTKGGPPAPRSTRKGSFWARDPCLRAAAWPVMRIKAPRRGPRHMRKGRLRYCDSHHKAACGPDIYTTRSLPGKQSTPSGRLRAHDPRENGAASGPAIHARAPQKTPRYTPEGSLSGDRRDPHRRSVSGPAIHAEGPPPDLWSTL